MTGEWHGKTAVITGGATGIGLALAQALAAAGMNIIIASRNERALAAAVANIAKPGVRALAIPCDVTDRARVRAMAERAMAEFGAVDLLCANAAATTVGRYVDHDDAEWDWALDTNLRGVTHCIQAFYGAMARRGSGSILLTTSQTTLAPDWVTRHGPYVAAKAALMALASSLRVEAAEFGINVSLLIPGGADTQFGSAARAVAADPSASFGFREEIAAPMPGYPMMLSPEDVARRAIAGLHANAEFIVTHPWLKPQVEQYFERILAAYDAAAAS